MKNAMTTTRNTNNQFLSPFMELQRNIDRLFDDFLNPWTGSVGQAQLNSAGWFIPACDVEETDSHYVLRMDVPGVKKENIKIELNDGQLVVSGTRHSEHKQDGKSKWAVERSYGEFRRVFDLPSVVDVEKVEATYQDGELILALPKTEAAKPRQIKIGEGKSGIFGKLLGHTENKGESKAA